MAFRVLRPRDRTRKSPECESFSGDRFGCAVCRFGGKTPRRKFVALALAQTFAMRVYAIPTVDRIVWQLSLSDRSGASIGSKRVVIRLENGTAIETQSNGEGTLVVNIDWYPGLSLSIKAFSFKPQTLVLDQRPSVATKLSLDIDLAESLMFDAGPLERTAVPTVSAAAPRRQNRFQRFLRRLKE